MVNAVRYEIEHVSRYRYAFQAQRCTMLLCLKPDNDRGQRLLDFEIQTVPPAFLNQETDCFGNRRHVLNLHSEHHTLEITARSTVEPAFLAPLPNRLGTDAWQEIGSWKDSFTHWEFVHPSALAKPSPLLADFVDRNDIQRR